MYFVMSDIHGCYNEMMKALEHWNRKTETLVVMGDLIDRGPDSLKVVQELMRLKREYPAQVIVLKGNHDEMFTSWLMDTDKQDLAFYYTETHTETLKSFFGRDDAGKKKFKKSSRQQRAEHILHNFREELRFLKSLELFHETDRCLFVHAGINLALGENWYTDTKAMLWIRNEFIYSERVALYDEDGVPKYIFFGHTPTALIRDEENTHDIWMNGSCDKIGIDGGVSMGGQLNALRLHEDGCIKQTITIPHELSVTSH